MTDGTLSFKDKIKTLQVMTRSGKGPAVRERRDERDGHRIKDTRDELGHVTTEHDTKDDRVDVLIRPGTAAWSQGETKEIPR